MTANAARLTAILICIPAPQLNIVAECKYGPAIARRAIFRWSLVLLGSGGEGDAAQGLGKASLEQDGKLLFRTFGRLSVGQGVGDGDKAVRISAYVAVAADGG